MNDTLPNFNWQVRKSGHIEGRSLNEALVLQEYSEYEGDVPYAR